MAPRCIAVYGLGRAGCSLAAAALDAGLQVGPLWNRGQERAARAAQLLGQQVHSGLPPPGAGQADLVLVAVTDGAVAEVTRALAAAGALATRPAVAHLAGALDLGPLDAAAERGCPVGSLHPARSLIGVGARLAGALCAIDGDAVAAPHLEAFAAMLGCRCARVPGARRPLYHAATAVAANDIAALVDQAAHLLTAAGIAPGLAAEAALDLAQGALGNAARVGLSAALTGPVARGEAEVLARHLAALRAEAPELAEVHRLLSRALLGLARAQGAAEERLTAVAALLEDT